MHSSGTFQHVLHDYWNKPYSDAVRKVVWSHASCSLHQGCLHFPRIMCFTQTTGSTFSMWPARSARLADEAASMFKRRVRSKSQHKLESRTSAPSLRAVCFLEKPLSKPSVIRPIIALHLTVDCEVRTLVNTNAQVLLSLLRSSGKKGTPHRF